MYPTGSLADRSFANLVLIVLALAAGVPRLAAAQAPLEQPYAVDYYYKVQWGYADEFIELYRMNHYPILERQVETGRFLSVTAVQPRYHLPEQDRWDYRVTIVFRDVEAAHDPGNEEEIIRELYPDQETFRSEEQRRFQILEAHWDVPVTDVDLTE